MVAVGLRVQRNINETTVTIIARESTPKSVIPCRRISVVLAQHMKRIIASGITTIILRLMIKISCLLLWKRKNTR